MPSRHRSASRAKGPSPKGSSPKGPSQRQLRVGEVLRHALSEILLNEKIRDPDLDGVSVTVTEVRPSPDMRHATAFVEPLGGKNAEAIVEALNRNKGFLRGQLGHRIALKFTPELRFIEDESFAEAERIEGILRSEKVARDLKAQRDEPAESEDGIAGDETGDDETRDDGA